jgi:hypothetical protein
LHFVLQVRKNLACSQSRFHQSGNRRGNYYWHDLTRAHVSVITGFSQGMQTDSDNDRDPAQFNEAITLPVVDLIDTPEDRLREAVSGMGVTAQAFTAIIAWHVKETEVSDPAIWAAALSTIQDEIISARSPHVRACALALVIGSGLFPDATIRSAAKRMKISYEGLRKEMKRWRVKYKLRPSPHDGRRDHPHAKARDQNRLLTPDA